eukprot:6180349-Pleurochrysis_carterae.AAC.2
MRSGRPDGQGLYARRLRTQGQVMSESRARFGRCAGREARSLSADSGTSRAGGGGSAEASGTVDASRWAVDGGRLGSCKHSAAGSRCAHATCLGNQLASALERLESSRAGCSCRDAKNACAATALPTLLHRARHGLISSCTSDVCVNSGSMHDAAGERADLERRLEAAARPGRAERAASVSSRTRAAPPAHLSRRRAKTCLK